MRVAAGARSQNASGRIKFPNVMTNIVPYFDYKVGWASPNGRRGDFGSANES
jgi:hypothetical protein